MSEQQNDGGKVLRVRVVLSIAIDRKEWAAEFGTPESAENIRATVQGEARSAVESAFSFHPSVRVR